MKTKRTIREQTAWEMMIRAGETKGEIILSPTLWFVLGICWGLGIGHALASPLQHEFKSPSFNGINQSSHYLTVENQETSRKAAIKAEIEDLQKQLERDANNTTLAKFIRNVESRIYSTLSRQLVEQMFGENPSDSGSFDIEGTGITYVKDDDKVEMTITDEDGSTTVITVPIGDFGF